MVECGAARGENESQLTASKKLTTMDKKCNFQSRTNATSSSCEAEIKLDLKETLPETQQTLTLIT